MAKDYSQWYNDLVIKGSLADYSAVRGCMVIKPYGFALWENMRDALDKMFKETGHENAYFPLFVDLPLHRMGTSLASCQHSIWTIWRRNWDGWVGLIGVQSNIIKLVWKFVWLDSRSFMMFFSLD